MAGWKKAIGVAVVALTTLGLTQAQAQSGKPLTKVRYEEVIRSVLYLPSYVAISKGFYKDAGLDVSMKTSQGGDKAMAALLSNSADIVLMGPEVPVFVQNSESPVKVKIFSGLTATDGFMLMSRTPVGSKPDWNAIKGKTVLGWRKASTPLIYLEGALRKNGVDPQKDITMITNLGAAAHVGAWLAGKQEYGLFPEPDASSLEKDGKAYFFASVGDVIGPVDYTVFTATDVYIKKNPQVIQAWTNGTARALKFVQATSSAELAKIALPYFPGITQEQMVNAIDRYKKYKVWKLTPVVEEAALDRLQDLFVDSGVLKSTERVKSNIIVVNDFAKQAK